VQFVLQTSGVFLQLWPLHPPKNSSQNAFPQIRVQVTEHELPSGQE
jgi:hypothetical protein